MVHDPIARMEGAGQKDASLLVGGLRGAAKRLVDKSQDVDLLESAEAILSACPSVPCLRLGEALAYVLYQT